MSDGVTAVLARMQQLDTQLRTVDPTWIGVSPNALGGATLAWSSGGTFGQALAAAGSDAMTTAAASSAGPGAAGATTASASATAAAGAPAAATTAAAGAPGAPAGATIAALTPALAQGGTAAGAAAPGTAALPLSWAISPAAARRIAASVQAASQAVDPGAVTGTVPVPVAAAVAAGKGIAGGVSFLLPLGHARVSQNFGPSGLAIEPPTTINGVRYAHFHQGIDYAAPEGTPVRAAADGVVVLAGRVSDGAVDVKIRHASGVETLYGHLQVGLKVHVGQRVKAGQIVGQVGMTGNTNGPHLHFTLRRGGVYLDPAPLLEQGVLPGVGKGTPSTVGAGSAAGAGGPNLAAFDAVASEIPYAKEIRAAAVEAGIDPLLLASMVKFESGFRPKAVSYCGAMGLCQLMPATAKALGVTDPFDPAQNLRGGARYLASNLKLFGRADLALAAYQAGRGSVDRAGGMPSSDTTRNYVSGIVKRWNYWLRKGAA